MGTVPTLQLRIPNSQTLKSLSFGLTWSWNPNHTALVRVHSKSLSKGMDDSVLQCESKRLRSKKPLFHATGVSC